MPPKNPICKKCGELRLPSGSCPACTRLRKKTDEEKLAKVRSPIPWIERDKKARALAKIEKARLKRAKEHRANAREDAQEAKYKRGRLLLSLVLGWLAMFLELFEKDDTGHWWIKPGSGEQLQTMLTAMEIILPETTAIFKNRPRSKRENEADALRHSLFTCMLDCARGWQKTEKNISALLQSGSISPEVATQMLSDLHQQVRLRFRFYPSTEPLDPHQKT